MEYVIMVLLVGAIVAVVASTQVGKNALESAKRKLGGGGAKRAQK